MQEHTHTQHNRIQNKAGPKKQWQKHLIDPSDSEALACANLYIRIALLCFYRSQHLILPSTCVHHFFPLRLQSTTIAHWKPYFKNAQSYCRWCCLCCSCSFYSTKYYWKYIFSTSRWSVCYDNRIFAKVDCAQVVFRGGLQQTF